MEYVLICMCMGGGGGEISVPKVTLDLRSSILSFLLQVIFLL